MNAFFELSREYDKMLYCKRHDNNSCNPHFHSHIELVYVMNGEIEVTINNETRRLSKGSAAVSSSYDVHHYCTPENSQVYILLIPLDSVALIDNIMRGKTFSSPFMVSNPDTPAFEEAIKWLSHFDDTYASLTATGYLYVVLGILVARLGLSERRYEGGSTQLIRNILIYMDENYLEDISVDIVAHKFGYNKSYMSRFFNSHLGFGFSHYLNTLRSRHAARLIRMTDKSLDEILYLSGFGSVRTFNRSFKDFYNMAPTEYKRRRAHVETDADREIDYFAYRWPEHAKEWGE